MIFCRSDLDVVFALLLLFARRTNLTANRYLGLALLVIVLWIAWVGCIYIRLDRYYARWNWLPLQFSLSLGPLVYLYWEDGMTAPNKE